MPQRRVIGADTVERGENPLATRCSMECLALHAVAWKIWAMRQSAYRARNLCRCNGFQTSVSRINLNKE
jgi:hypothetical protein